MNSTITIEKIDLVKSRIPQATYLEVKKALTQSSGDVLEAIIILEEEMKDCGVSKKAKKAMDNVMAKDCDFKEIGEQLKELLKRSNVIRIIIEKNNKIIINLPLTIGVLGAAWSPLCALIGLSTAIITKYKIKIQNEEDGTFVDLGELSEEKLELIKKMMMSTAKDVKEAAKDIKKDDKDITDELIAEDEFIDKD